MSLGLLKLWQLVSIIKNKLQARTAANFRLRIALLAVFSLLNVGLGGLLYKWIAAEQSWGEALFTVYAVLYSIPGADITNAPTRGGTVVLNLIFMFGLLVFATILAMITEEVNSILLAARSGRAPINMSGHILLLNWNAQVPFLLDQFEAVQQCLGPAGRGHHKLSGRPLVILADRDKEDMDSLVVGFMRKHKLEVHTRSGKPYRLEHLDRVSASRAAAVLVLHPEEVAPSDPTAAAAADAATCVPEGCGGSSAQGSAAGGATGASGSSSSGVARPSGDDGAAALKLQTVMALTAQLKGRKAAVVVQVPESDSCSGGGRSSRQLEMLDAVLARSGHDVGLMELPVKRMVNSLAVQAALQPWSASIYTQLLQHGRQPDLTFYTLTHTLFRAAQQPAKASGPTRSSASSSSSGSFGAGHHPSPVGDLGLTSSFSLRSSSTVFKRPASVLAAGTAAAAGTAGRSHLRTSFSCTPGTSAAAAAAAAPEGTLLFDEVRVRYEGAGSIVLGYYRSSAGELVLNPAKGAWCEPGDVLVALTRTAGRASSVFATLWQPLLSSITSTSTTQQQQQQQQTDRAVAAIATAAAAGALAAAAAGNKGTAGSTAQHQAAPAPAALGLQQDQQRHHPRGMGQQHHVHQHQVSSTLRHPRSSLAPIVEQQQQQEQLESTVGLCGIDGQQHNVGSDDQQQQQQVGSSQLQQQQQQQQEGPPLALSLCDDASHFASPFATVSAAADEDDALPLETEPLLGPGPAAASAAAPSATAAAAAAAAAVCSLDASTQQPGGSSPPGLRSGPSVLGPAGLRSAPSWLFSARKLMQQQDQHLATQRLNRLGASSSSNWSSSSIGSNGSASGRSSGSLQRDQQRSVVVAGFSAVECAHDLLPHFLDFAPAGSRVVFAVGPFDEPPPELDYEGTLEEDEQRDGRTPVLHQIHYRFVQVSCPSSAEGLQAAGVLEADALLLGPEEGVRPNSAEADAQVLGSLVELQHLLSHSERYQRTHSGPFGTTSSRSSSKQPSRKNSWGRKRSSFRHLFRDSSISSESEDAARHTSAAAAAAACATVPSGAEGGVDSPYSCNGDSGTCGLAAGDSSCWPSQLSAQGVQQHRLNMQQPEYATAQGQQTSGSSPQQPGQQRFGAQGPQRPLHVVACVTSTASKAVAAAFFGAMGPDAAASAAASGRLGDVSRGVVGACEFSYELIVPGEVESAVLVQVAGEPLYTQVVHELLGTPEGCELYLLPPAAFGCCEGETVRFAELQAVGRLINKTVIGVVAGGRVVLAPGREWRWSVQEADKVAALAMSWEC